MAECRPVLHGRPLQRGIGPGKDFAVVDAVPAERVFLPGSVKQTERNPQSLAYQGFAGKLCSFPLAKLRPISTTPWEYLHSQGEEERAVPAGKINRTVRRIAITAPSPNPKGAGKHHWGLPALVTIQQAPAGVAVSLKTLR